jgi:hypothetical protein
MGEDCTIVGTLVVMGPRLRVACAGTIATEAAMAERVCCDTCARAGQ